MREIKYDAIYKPTGEHFVPVDINFNDKTLTGNFDGKKLDWCHFSLDGKTGDAILREYTGLKDKNGKEIYEGDVLKGGHLHLTGGFTIDNSHGATVTFAEGMFKCGRVSLISFAKRAEVIGNIYENPELLEGEYK
ncbi:hypothetical protein GLV94_05215 [Virgibacillus halodenitrificans]|uniref:YopX family protein n=1 Tax=Virgibacillus halodenitrificans TaxID=1482 RepID=UPI001368AA4F|nr:YopX family protein [Virgibacillus halodenitrificans]MYL45034.1 hypothetical protein [Virgibacillus halodenitrificans]